MQSTTNSLRLAKTILFAGAMSLLAFGLSKKALAAGPANQTIMLVWDDPKDSSIVYFLYSTNNISAPVATWPLVAVIPQASLTNPSPTTLGYRLSVAPGLAYYTLTASNLWGTSPFSTVAGTPPVLPLFTNLAVLKP